MSLKILDVGQCGFDGPRMADLWRSELGAEVTDAPTASHALRLAQGGSFDVVLVNRVLAGDGSSGLDLIRDLLAGGRATPVMLVSDHADAQEEAVGLGALRGFGKTDLDAPDTLRLVAQASGQEG